MLRRLAITPVQKHIHDGLTMGHVIVIAALKLDVMNGIVGEQQHEVRPPFQESSLPADLVLAMLAHGGEERLGEIVRRIAKLPKPQRDKALVQLALLAGLRKLSGKVRMEVRKIGMIIDISDNVIVQEWRQDAIAEGLAEGLAKGLEKGLTEGRAKGLTEGRAKGLAEGQRKLVIEQLQQKFGRLPAWARERLDAGKPVQMERWGKKLLTAKTLEQVFGRR